MANVFHCLFSDKYDIIIGQHRKYMIHTQIVHFREFSFVRVNPVFRGLGGVKFSAAIDKWLFSGRTLSIFFLLCRGACAIINRQIFPWNNRSPALYTKQAGKGELNENEGIQWTVRVYTGALCGGPFRKKSENRRMPDHSLQLTGMAIWKDDGTECSLKKCCVMPVVNEADEMRER